MNTLSWEKNERGLGRIPSSPVFAFSRAHGNFERPDQLRAWNRLGSTVDEGFLLTLFEKAPSVKLTHKNASLKPSLSRDFSLGGTPNWCKSIPKSPQSYGTREELIPGKRWVLFIRAQHLAVKRARRTWERVKVVGQSMLPSMFLILSEIGNEGLGPFI